MQNDVWKAIAGYEGLYSINSKGEVYSHQSGKRVKGHMLYQKHKIVTLYKEGIPQTFAVARLLEELE